MVTVINSAGTHSANQPVGYVASKTRTYKLSAEADAQRVQYREYRGYGAPGNGTNAPTASTSAALAPSIADFGVDGDIYINITEATEQLYGRVQGSWILWPGPTKSVKTSVAHPTREGYFLAAGKNALGWADWARMKRISMSGLSSSKLITVVLDSRDEKNRVDRELKVKKRKRKRVAETEMEQEPAVLARDRKLSSTGRDATAHGRVDEVIEVSSDSEMEVIQLVGPSTVQGDKTSSTTAAGPSMKPTPKYSAKTRGSGPKPTVSSPVSSAVAAQPVKDQDEARKEQGASTSTSNLPSSSEILQTTTTAVLSPTPSVSLPSPRPGGTASVNPNLQTTHQLLLDPTLQQRALAAINHQPLWPKTADGKVPAPFTPPVPSKLPTAAAVAPPNHPPAKPISMAPLRESSGVGGDPFVSQLETQRELKMEKEEEKRKRKRDMETETEMEQESAVPERERRLYSGDGGGEKFRTDFPRVPPKKKAATAIDSDMELTRSSEMEDIQMVGPSVQALPRVSQDYKASAVTSDPSKKRFNWKPMPQIRTAMAQRALDEERQRPFKMEAERRQLLVEKATWEQELLEMRKQTAAATMSLDAVKKDLLKTRMTLDGTQATLSLRQVALDDARQENSGLRAQIHIHLQALRDVELKNALLSSDNEVAQWALAEKKLELEQVVTKQAVLESQILSQARSLQAAKEMNPKLKDHISRLEVAKQEHAQHQEQFQSNSTGVSETDTGRSRRSSTGDTSNPAALAVSGELANKLQTLVTEYQKLDKENVLLKEQLAGTSQTATALESTLTSQIRIQELALKDAGDKNAQLEMRISGLESAEMSHAKSQEQCRVLIKEMWDKNAELQTQRMIDRLALDNAAKEIVWLHERHQVALTAAQAQKKEKEKEKERSEEKEKEKEKEMEKPQGPSGAGSHSSSYDPLFVSGELVNQLQTPVTEEVNVLLKDRPAGPARVNMEVALALAESIAIAAPQVQSQTNDLAPSKAPTPGDMDMGTPKTTTSGDSLLNRSFSPVRHAGPLRQLLRQGDESHQQQPRESRQAKSATVSNATPATPNAAPENDGEASPVLQVALGEAFVSATAVPLGPDADMDVQMDNLHDSSTYVSTLDSADKTIGGGRRGHATGSVTGATSESSVLSLSSPPTLIPSAPSTLSSNSTSSPKTPLRLPDTGITRTPSVPIVMAEHAAPVAVAIVSMPREALDSDTNVFPGATMILDAGSRLDRNRLKIPFRMWCRFCDAERGTGRDKKAVGKSFVITVKREVLGNHIRSAHPERLAEQETMTLAKVKPEPRDEGFPVLDENTLGTAYHQLCSFCTHEKKSPTAFGIQESQEVLERHLKVAHPEWYEQLCQMSEDDVMEILRTIMTRVEAL